MYVSCVFDFIVLLPIGVIKNILGVVYDDAPYKSTLTILTTLHICCILLITRAF